MKIDYSLQYSLSHEDGAEYFQKRIAVEQERIQPFLPELRTGAVLEIGCGRGYTMGAILASGYKEVTGIDIDQSQIDYAKGKGLNVERIDSIQSYLSKRKGTYSLITMLDVLEHIPVEQQVEVAQAIHDALIPGGRLIVQVPNANSILASRWRYIDCTHVNSYTEQSIYPILRSGGFTKIAVPPLDNTLPRPSLRPNKLFSKQTRMQFLRWTVRHLWRLVILAEIGDTAMKIPLGLNLIAIADKPD
jgi:SAM-dependent methyltransferase